jgi:hypothetical protein|tara:strand:- start:479 stop:766 length:288 start_codon:yes stop_codon:yes gene_type:complete
MSRPKPEILLEKIDKETYKTEQILASAGIWSVYYQGRAINLKTQNMLVSYPGPKYKKVSFSNSGHAINLAKKLNKKFNCTDFTVELLKKGEQIYP